MFWHILTNYAVKCGMIGPELDLFAYSPSSVALNHIGYLCFYAIWSDQQYWAQVYLINAAIRDEEALPRVSGVLTGLVGRLGGDSDIHTVPPQKYQ